MAQKAFSKSNRSQQMQMQHLAQNSITDKLRKPHKYLQHEHKRDLTTMYVWPANVYNQGQDKSHKVKK